MWFKRKKSPERHQQLSQSLHSLQSLLNDTDRREPSLDGVTEEPDVERPTGLLAAARPVPDRKRETALKEPAPPDSANRWQDLNLSFDAEPVLPPRETEEVDSGDDDTREPGEPEAASDEAQAGDGHLDDSRPPQDKEPEPESEAEASAPGDPTEQARGPGDPDEPAVDHYDGPVEMIAPGTPGLETELDLEAVDVESFSDSVDGSAAPAGDEAEALSEPRLPDPPSAGVADPDAYWREADQVLIPPEEGADASPAADQDAEPAEPVPAAGDRQASAPEPQPPARSKTKTKTGAGERAEDQLDLELEPGESEDDIPTLTEAVYVPDPPPESPRASESPQAPEPAEDAMETPASGPTIMLGAPGALEQPGDDEVESEDYIEWCVAQLRMRLRSIDNEPLTAEQEAQLRDTLSVLLDKLRSDDLEY